MSINKGDVLTIPVYNQEAENNAIELEWQQARRTRTARYYVVKARNQSKDNADVLIFIQDRFYKDFNRNCPGARQEGDSWVVSIDRQFQYGQKNKSGEGRWLALHDKMNIPYQHRFLVLTIESKISEQAKNLAKIFGAEDIADQVMKPDRPFVGDYLRDF
ncbi:uncharacterized protein FIESC28_01851 [Fusarium coffeatum]|uniref:Uncharacterized protein n=1 Tax=Fusarium coffeatum TaxID=231269 RepID=A0A366S7X6_9HYPO|nr:uncharacterized protein FIESC28_01851 [Fusarium coffeatum]RBR25414.1 hypothetical protein FIESC28_01851 [Fusarium coffeatum]